MLLLSLSTSWRLILQQLPQGLFELLLDLGFVNGVFMPDSQNRFFAELLRVDRLVEPRLTLWLKTYAVRIRPSTRLPELVSRTKETDRQVARPVAVAPQSPSPLCPSRAPSLEALFGER